MAGGGHIFRKIGRRSVMKARRVVGRVQQEAAHLEVMKRWIPTSVKREVEEDGHYEADLYYPRQSAFARLTRGGNVTQAELRRAPGMSQRGVNESSQSEYFRRRSEMNLSIDMESQTSDLWHYVNQLDVAAFVLASFRPVIVVTLPREDGGGHGVTLHKFGPAKHAPLDQMKCGAMFNLLLNARLLPPWLVSQVAPFLFPHSWMSYRSSTPTGTYEEGAVSRVTVTSRNLGGCSDAIQALLSAPEASGSWKKEVHPIFLVHNGSVEGVHGHYWPAMRQSSQPRTSHSSSSSSSSESGHAPLELGEAPTKKKKVPQKKDRHKIQSSWFDKYPWLRQGGTHMSCSVCQKYRMEAPGDHLGKGEMLVSKARSDKMMEHDKNVKHLKCMRLYSRSGNAVAAQKGATLLRLGVELTSENELMCKHITTIYQVVKMCLPLSNVVGILRLRALDGQVTAAYQNHGFWDPIVGLIAKGIREKQDARIAKSIGSGAFSLMMDGSMTRTLLETEVVFYRYFDHAAGKVVTEFVDLVEILRELSKDKASCDADATFLSCKALADARAPGKYDSLSETLVSASFDGANVMLGSNDSVASRLLGAAPNAVIIHAVAHRNELTVAAAFGQVPILKLIEEVIQGTYNKYCMSSKKFEALKEIANAMEQDPILRFKGIHGIRWMASKKDALRVVLRNLIALILQTKREAMPAGSLNEDSPPVSFKGKTLSVLNAGTGRMVRATVTSVPAEGTEPLAGDYVLQYNDKRTTTHTKEQLVTMLNFTEELAATEEWQLYVSLTQHELVMTMHFLYDLEHELAILSKVFQADNLAPTDIENAINRTEAQIKRLENEDGAALKSFLDEYDDDKETWRYISLEKQDGCDVSFNSTRRLLTSALVAQLRTNFGPLLKSPIFAASKALEHRSWPVNDAVALRSHGNGEVEVLIEQFKDLKCMVDFDRKEAMRQWERLKFELPKHAFFRHTSFVGFWEHVAMHFDTGALTGYSEFIKLALAVLLIVTDTSCCERAYSLMNRIHTYLRNRLEVKTLNDLMCICSNGPELEDFDPMPTLKAWLQLEKRGRNTSIIQRSASSSSSSSIGASGQTSD